jgi:hypothetical protein
LALLPRLAVATDDARALVKRVVDALPQVPLKATLELSTAQGTRKIEMSSKRVGGDRASYLEVVAPESLQGIRFLFIEHASGPPDQYIKVAAARNAVRVTDQIRKQPFLDSAFYVSDMVEPQIDMYEYSFAGEEEVGGRKCRLVESVPKKPEEEIYSKTIIALEPHDLLVLRRQFFDKRGKPLKTWTIKKVEKVDGFWTFRQHEMVNVQENVKSRLDLLEIEYNVELSDAMFTPTYLLR